MPSVAPPVELCRQAPPEGSGFGEADTSPPRGARPILALWSRAVVLENANDQGDNNYGENPGFVPRVLDKDRIAEEMPGARAPEGKGHTS